MSQDLKVTVKSAADHYMPALRWKKGEISALRQFLRSDDNNVVTPLILVDNVAERQQNEAPRVSARIPVEPKKYIDYTASEMQKLFHSRRALVDTSLFDSQRTDIDGLSEFFSNAIAKLSRLVPVLRLTDASARLASFRGQVDGKGIALRLPEKSFAATAQVDDFLRGLNLDESSVDLIADLEFLEQERPDIEPIADLLSGLSRRRIAWRSMTLLSGAYPLKPSFGENGWLDLARSDWITYAKLTHALVTRKGRVASFGDYGIINPNAKPTSGSGGGGGTRPIIRYCATDVWRVRRASAITKKGSLSEYFDLSRECVTNDAYMGRDFSFGDCYIDDRAMGRVSQGGNASSYITVDINHHLKFVTAQVTGVLPKAQPRVYGELPSLGTIGDEHGSFDEYWDV